MGGYQIIDFVGIDLKDGGSNLLIYNLLNNTTRKVILGTSLVYDNVELKDEYFTCEVDGTSYVLKNASFSITIATDGTITCEKTSSGGGEGLVFDSISDLSDYIVENYEIDTYFQIIATETDSTSNSVVGFGVVENGSFNMASTITFLVESYDETYLISLNTQTRVVAIVGHQDQH